MEAPVSLGTPVIRFVRRHGLGVVIVLVWLAMMGRLTHLHDPGSSIPSLSTGAAEPEQAFDEWMGIYYQGKKVGYCHRSFGPEGEGWRSQEQMYVEMVAQGFPLEVSMRTEGLTGPDLGLQSFDFTLQSGLVDTRIQGQMEGNTLKLELVTAGTKSSQSMELTTRPTLPGSRSLFIRKQPLQAGKKFSLPVLDPATLSLKEMLVEVKGEDFVDLEGEAVPCYRLSASYAGVSVDFWVNSSGETIREKTPLGWELVRENREKALTAGWDSKARIDVVSATSVAVQGAPIPNPRDARFLSVLFPPDTTEGLELSGERQELQPGQFPLLYVRRENLNGLKPSSIPVDQVEMRTYLGSDLFIQADHPEMIEQAKRIAGDEKDSLAVAGLLTRWVHDNLEKRVVPSLPSALEVLHRRAGDCNEHTVLYVALARALGLPARTNVGLVFVEGRFYYHAWPEVYVGQWVALDPVFDQLPADATHIRIIRGGLERQVEIVRLIGKLKTLNVIAVQ